MLLEHERSCNLGMDALVTVCSWNTNGIIIWAWMLWSPYALGTRTELWFGHGCSGHRMLWEHERDYGLGVDALVSGCSGNTNGVLGECPWSPGTWRRWIQTPSMPLKTLLVLPYITPYFPPFKEFRLWLILEGS